MKKIEEFLAKSGNEKGAREPSLGRVSDPTKRAPRGLPARGRDGDGAAGAERDAGERQRAGQRERAGSVRRGEGPADGDLMGPGTAFQLKKLRKAHSRLYRSRCLHANAHFAALLFEIKECCTLLHRSSL